MAHIDRWTLTCVFVLFGIGLLLGLAASVPLASRNGLEPFFYVQKQAFFGGVGLAVMIAVSMMSPDTVRAWVSWASLAPWGWSPFCP